MASRNSGDSPSESLSLDLDKILQSVMITEISDVRSAAEAFAEFSSALGLRVAVCPNLSSRKPIIDASGTVLSASLFHWGDVGRNWWLDPDLAKNSPLARACRYESETFWANRFGFHTPHPNPYLSDIPLADFETNARCKAAIIAPVHLPFRQIAVAGFVSLERDRDDLSYEYRTFGPALGEVAHLFVSGYVQAMREMRRIPSDCDLTKREVECLSLAAKGMTDGQIANEIEVSHSTVRFHLTKSAEKLDSVSRAQTLFKASQLGYIADAT